MCRRRSSDGWAHLCATLLPRFSNCFLAGGNWPPFPSWITRDLRWSIPMRSFASLSSITFAVRSALITTAVDFFLTSVACVTLCSPVSITYALTYGMLGAAKGMTVAPEAKLNDGLMDLLLIRTDATPDLAKMFEGFYRGVRAVTNSCPLCCLISARARTLSLILWSIAK